MSKVIIGVPVKNDLESLEFMIDSLYRSVSIDFTLAFAVGENCNQETLDFLNNVPEQQGVTVVILNDPKKGTKTPLEAYNLLFDYAKYLEADLLLSQTDVIYPRLYKRDWLSMLQVAANLPECSIATCINGGGVSGPDYIDGFRWVGGWCTYIPFKTIEKIGGFDSSYPNGYGVDIDYTRKAMMFGQIAVINYWVDHHQMNEREHDNNPNTEQMKQDSAKYFRTKWGIE